MSFLEVLQDSCPPESSAISQEGDRVVSALQIEHDDIDQVQREIGHGAFGWSWAAPLAADAQIISTLVVTLGNMQVPCYPAT